MTLTKNKPTRRTKTDQKRSGHHHRVGQHYLKTYWPYLPMVAILVLGFVGNGWLANMHRGVLGYATDLSASSLLTNTNVQRNTYRQTPLQLSSQLDDAAQTKANDMATRDYWSHDTPDGRTPWSFITASGYDYRTAGENLAYGFNTAGSVITGWMNSPEHRANLLNADYQEVGFGITNVPNYQNHGPETLVVAMYASSATTAPAYTASTIMTSPAIATTKNAPLPSPTSEPQTQHIARIQLLSRNTVSITILGLCGIFALIFLSIRHGLAWRKTLTRGEQFILHHPILDLAAVVIVTGSILFFHTAGLIR